jgi:prepilin-type processing-associated H-X9-DG protein
MEHWLHMRSDQGTALDFANDQPLNLKKYTQLPSVPPGPSRVFVFTDEHRVCIDDGVFTVPSPWQFAEVNPTPTWVSLPSERHGGGDNFSFADGHVEHRHWLWRRNPRSFSGTAASPANGKDAQDIRWVQHRIPGAPAGP